MSRVRCHQVAANSGHWGKKSLPHPLQKDTDCHFWFFLLSSIIKLMLQVAILKSTVASVHECLQGIETIVSLCKYSLNWCSPPSRQVL